MDRALRYPLWVLGLVLLVWYTLYQIHAVHLDDRLQFWLSRQLPMTAMQEPAIGLGRLQVQVDGHQVPGVDDNLSGLAFDADRQKLWGVINNPEELLSLDFQGNLLTRHPLQGFRDVEDVAYLGDGWLLLVEEQSHALLAVQAPAGRDTPIRREEARGLTLAIDAGDNDGLEGVAYDPRHDRLFVVKEKSPIKIYQVNGFKRSLTRGLDLQVIDHDDWVKNSVIATDLSGATVDPVSGNLLLLSHESKRLMELSQDGRLLDYLTLRAKKAGLREDVPQGEGLAFDDKGNLYLSSEPNLFYSFRR